MYRLFSVCQSQNHLIEDSDKFSLEVIILKYRIYYLLVFFNINF